jgi:uncharacterized protein
MTQAPTHNRLNDEASLYLRQHAEHPIFWQPWGPVALNAARELNRPIFLSIGYSACHWCHVMARESFIDPTVASFLNDHFICIKVDREEYPDIDQYYQQASLLFSNNGGWPLSAFLLPDTRPFFVGTYFAPKTQGGESGFLDLTRELKRAFEEEKDKVTDNAHQVSEMIHKGAVPPEKVEFQGHFPAAMAIMGAVDQFYDQTHGGYGKAPKFPHYPFWEFALEQMLEGMIDKPQGEKIIRSLEAMLMGGLFDQVRGGAHRYATDAAWTIPHFEKMLYDQAGLLRVLARLGLLYPSPLVFDATINTLDYLENEMLSEKNYFFAAQDAESEGVEGLYFTFTKVEFEDAINNHDDSEETLASNQEKILSWFKITENGNFTHKLNILTLNLEKRDEIFSRDGINLLRKVRHALLQERKNRIPPATDPKGVASWNFMMVSALVDLIQYTQIEAIRERASSLFNRVLQGVFEQFIDRDDQSTRLRHTNTREQSLPYAEDFVFFIEMQMRIYEVTGNPIFKNNVRESLNFMIREFVEGSDLLTRAKLSQEFELYPNQAMSAFDNSFRSPLSTFVGLVRRARALFQDPEFASEVKPLEEKLTHTVLKNPISGGEGLRALIYPDQAYRVVQVPLSWLKNDKFVGFLPYFMPRFVIDYVGEMDQVSDQSWQICSAEQCELKGDGIEEFIKTLGPKSPPTDTTAGA